MSIAREPLLDLREPGPKTLLLFAGNERQEELRGRLYALVTVYRLNLV